MKKIVFILLSAVMCLTANAQFFEKVNHIGALESNSSKDWTKSWTQWNPKNATYGTVSDTNTLNSPTGEVKYFNTLECWKLEVIKSGVTPPQQPVSDLPF